MNIVEPDSTELDHKHNPSQHSDSNKSLDYYAQLDHDLLERLENCYALDYELFRYKRYPDLDDRGLVLDF